VWDAVLDGMFDMFGRVLGRVLDRVLDEVLYRIGSWIRYWIGHWTLRFAVALTIFDFLCFFCGFRYDMCFKVTAVFLKFYLMDPQRNTLHECGLESECAKHQS